MKSFKDFLTEKQMDTSAALKIFGITTIPDADTIKKLFRQKAKDIHPDKGGSEEDMKDLNNAYEILKKGKSSRPVEYDGNTYAEQAKRYRDIAKSILNDLTTKFNADIYIKYLHDISNKNFRTEIIGKPKESEKFPHYAGIAVKFISDDGESIFDLDVSIYLNDVMHSSGLGSSDVGAKMHISAYGFHNNRKQKMAKRDWQFTNSQGLFNDPALVFPKDKMTKIFGSPKVTKFTRKDALLFLKNKLGTDLNISGPQVWAYIPLFGDYMMSMYRTTMLGQAAWYMGGLYIKRKHVDHISGFLMEDEKSFIELMNMVTKIRGQEKEFPDPSSTHEQKALSTMISKQIKDINHRLHNV